MTVVPDMSLWTGRIDAAEGQGALRWHQWIKPLLPNVPAGAALIGLASDEGVKRNQGRTGARLGPPALRSALANLAQQSGLDGVVCSAHEAALLRAERGEDFVLVTPGIRLNTEGNQDDQRRIMTPAQALAAGSSYLVMGRPITQAADPLAVLREVNALV